MEHIREAGAGRSVNIESIAGRVTMDAISLAIFGKSRGCVEELALDTRPELGMTAAEGK